MLGATIQALEVQRMTLSTLKTMNVQMTDLRDSLQIKLPETGAPADDDAPDDTSPTPPARKAGKAKKVAPPAAPAVDPMQWWGALTKQFTQLATTAMKDSATDAAKGLAGAMVKQSVEAAGQTLKKAAGVPAKVARKAASARTRRPAAR